MVRYCKKNIHKISIFLALKITKKYPVFFDTLWVNPLLFLCSKILEFYFIFFVFNIVKFAARREESSYS